MSAPIVQGQDSEQTPLLASKPSVSLAPIVIALAIGIFLVAMDVTIVLSSYASIGSELDQLQKTSWISTGYLLTLTSFQPLYGKLSDIFGRKSCLLFAYTVFGVACLLCGLARNMNELIAARALAGVGGGGISTVVSIIMSDVVPLRSRGTWQGILNIVFATGSSAGAPLGGFLADTIGWRWVFIIQAPVAILAIIAVSLGLNLPQTSTADFYSNLKRVDFAGALSLVLTVLLFLLGLDRGGNISWNDNITTLTLVMSLVFLVVFLAVETTLAKEPFAPKRVILSRSLIPSFLGNFFGMASVFSLLFHVSLYFQAVLGKSSFEAGLWLLPTIAGNVVGSMAGGLIIQSTGKYYYLTVTGYAVLLAGTIAVALTTGFAVRSFAGVVLGLLLTSFGIGEVITTGLIDIIANAGPEDQAIATAASYLFRSLGSVIGLSVGSSIVQDNLRKYLRMKLSGNDVDQIVRRVRESLSYLDQLDPSTRRIVRGSYDKAIQVSFWFSVGVAACATAASLFIKEKSLSR